MPLKENQQQPRRQNHKLSAKEKKTLERKSTFRRKVYEKTCDNGAANNAGTEERRHGKYMVGFSQVAFCTL